MSHIMSNLLPETKIFGLHFYRRRYGSSCSSFEYLYSPGNPVATKKGKKKQTHKLN